MLRKIPNLSVTLDLLEKASYIMFFLGYEKNSDSEHDALLSLFAGIV